MDIFILYYLVFITVYCSICLITYLHNICFQNNQRNHDDQNNDDDQNINKYEILV